MKRTLLIVEDNDKIVATLRLYLERDGFEVQAASDGARALEMLRENTPDLLVLDWMLPEVDGLEVCRFVRRHSDVPILLLTARSTVDDKLTGLETGADDYVTKPFSPREIVGRVHALLRRSVRGPALRSVDLELDPRARIARHGAEVLDLTPTEFKLLEALMRARGKALSRAEIASSVFGWDYAGDLRRIDGHVKNLRRKLVRSGARAPAIATVFGVGYRLGDDDA